MSTGSITVKELPVGAEIVDFDVSRTEDQASRAELYRLWLEHGLLLFRNVESSEQHLALSGVFGEPELHPMEEVRAPEEPLFMQLEGGQARVYDTYHVRRGRLAWHRDTGYTRDICKGGMLRLLETPAVLGETWFADTGRAYDELPADVKERIDGLEWKSVWRMGARLNAATFPGATWKTVRPATREEDPDADPAADRVSSERDPVADALRFPAVVHPLVMKHPESGRVCLFLSPKDMECIIGVSDSESEDLLNYLIDHMTADRFVYRHHWSLNQAVVWDNRRVIHAAEGHRVGDARVGRRTTLTGALDSGRYFEPERDLASV